LGANYLDEPFFGDCVYGLNAGLSGKGNEETVGLLHGKPGVLYSVWFVSSAAYCNAAFMSATVLYPKSFATYATFVSAGKTASKVPLANA
jgi:hypothetical protein